MKRIAAVLFVAALLGVGAALITAADYWSSGMVFGREEGW